MSSLSLPPLPFLLTYSIHTPPSVFLPPSLVSSNRNGVTPRGEGGTLIRKGWRNPGGGWGDCSREQTGRGVCVCVCVPVAVDGRVSEAVEMVEQVWSGQD